MDYNNLLWSKLFNTPELKHRLDQAIHKLYSRYAEFGITRITDAVIRPNINDVFRAFNMFDVKDTRVVLIGQDPYPAYGVADGLCFSSRTNMPMSVKYVFKALKNHGIEPPKSADLSGWAKQGVLMINSNLTRNPVFRFSNGKVLVTNEGGSDSYSLHDFWQPFTSELVRYLIVNREQLGIPVLVFMLWGRYAASIVSTCPDQHVYMLYYSHPVAGAMGNNQKFEECDHFCKVNEILIKYDQKPIDWSV
jgi:uracil-DNA glycosylase